MNWLTHFSFFLLAISSILPLVNPLGSALIINPYFRGASAADHKTFAAKIAVYSLLLGLGTLILGSWLLKFMGIDLPTIQLGGGILVARMGLKMLDAEAADTSADAVNPTNTRNLLFYPLAFPLTIGPGSIAALITLSAHVHKDNAEQTMIGLVVLSTALASVCVMTYFCYAYSSVVIRRIGSQGGLIMGRLSAFLVFCIGMQMAISGLMRTFPHLFSATP